MVKREGLNEEDKQVLKQEIVKMGLYAVRQAKQKAPVDTGRLRASITIADSDGLIQPIDNEALTGDGVEPSNENFVVKIGTNVSYSSFIEFGTVKMSPQPFLRPAVDEAFTRFDFERT